MSGYFFQLQKIYFFSIDQKKISKKISKNILKISDDQSEKSKFFKIFAENFRKNCFFFVFGSIEKIFFGKVDFFRTSRSMQNLLADRMGALRAPSFESGENNPTFGEKKSSKFADSYFSEETASYGNDTEMEFVTGGGSCPKSASLWNLHPLIGFISTISTTN